MAFFFFSSRRRHTRLQGDWSSDVCSSDLRAAVEEGIVPGGGVALLRASKAIDKLKIEGDEKVGAQIVKRALEEPIRQIVENAGLEGSVVVEKVKAETVPTRGFDAETMEFVDMLQAVVNTSGYIESVVFG